jgi:hypothetical protein
MDPTMNRVLRKLVGETCIELTGEFCRSVDRRILRRLEDPFTYSLRNYVENAMVGQDVIAKKYLKQVKEVIKRAGQLSEEKHAG